MTDTVHVIDEEGWLGRLRRRAAAVRQPLSASLELTRRCNLKCRHCYLCDQALQRAERGCERDTASVLKSLDEWTEAGVLNLLITGGDPMVRKDFAEVYRHAAELGLRVTVFCDGILVTDRIVALFRELPPRKVEISIYGATAETYESVTRVPGSQARAWQGIHRLHRNGIRIALKTMLLTLNAHELDAMAAQAEALGCRFRYDAALFPCLSGGDAEPLDYRVAPEAVVAHDLATPDRRRRWAAAIRRLRDQPAGESVYACGAGATYFHMDPYGNFSPCLMAAHYRYPGRDRAFRDVWRDDLIEVRRRKRTRGDTCLAGALRGACTHCPAFNYLETGDEEAESDYMKKTTLLRVAAVRATREGADL